MSMRSGASVSQDLAERTVPRGARMTRPGSRRSMECPVLEWSLPDRSFMKLSFGDAMQVLPARSPDYARCR